MSDLSITEQIYSDSYTDILVPRSLLNAQGFQEIFGSYNSLELGTEYGVLLLPRENTPENYLEAAFYNSIPKLYTPLSTESLTVSGIPQVERQPALSLTGRGVLIGFLDTGIDYTHPAFRDAQGKTRILSIWDQTVENGPHPTLYPYGAEYTKDDIDRALASEAPLKIVPSRDTTGHGTHLAGVAAGTPDPAAEFSGAAPDSMILVVKLKPAKPHLMDYFRIYPDAQAYQENDLMAAMNYLVRAAQKYQMPLVICIGLGSNQGSHDGYMPLCKTLTALSNLSGVVPVVGCGNETGRAHHYYGSMQQDGQVHTAEIRVPENSSGFSLELWGQAPAVFSVGFQSPVGEVIPKIPARLGQSEDISFLLERTKIQVNYEIVQPVSGDQLIFMRFFDPTPGIWNINVYSSNTTFNEEFHMWLPITGFSSPDIVFLAPNPYTTLTTPSVSSGAISVSTYDAATKSLYIHSGRGYGRLGSIKPELCSPGVALTGPGRTESYIEQTGSSQAAALTAGACALLLQWGLKREPVRYYTASEIKSFLIRGATRSRELSYPNREWGYGALNVYQVFTSLMGI